MCFLLFSPETAYLVRYLEFASRNRTQDREDANHLAPRFLGMQSPSSRAAMLRWVISGEEVSEFKTTNGLRCCERGVLSRN